jgi:CRISPR type I-E-associated protein CasB/Cse2
MHYLTASLFAYHPDNTNDGDFGDTFRKIFLKRGSNKSLEQSFVALLKSNPEDFPFHMRRAIAIAKSENIPVNWNVLFFDMKRWPYDSKFPPYEKWAQSFWKIEPKKKGENDE